MQLTVVGLGPGDPELITVKGKQAIEAADVIFAPRSQPAEASRALRIAQPWYSPQQQVVLLTLPMVRDAERQAATYHATASVMAAALAHYGHTARGVYLLLGDPLLYGTFTYLGHALTEQLPTLTIEIIPGVTSFAATAARAGVPLSMHDEQVAIVPASAYLAAVSSGIPFAHFHTVIIMKVGRVLPQVIAALDALGLLDRAIYAEQIGMPEERIVRDVGRLATYQGPYLSLLIVRNNGEQHQ